jgi:hypothetical protein
MNARRLLLLGPLAVLALCAAAPPEPKVLYEKNPNAETTARSMRYLVMAHLLKRLLKQRIA